MRGMGKAVLAAGVMLWAMPAAAQSQFVGSWKIDEAASKPADKPSVVTLEGGTYACISCTYPYKIAADGAFHPISGNPYVDQVAVTVIDDSSIRFRTQKAGKLLVDETRVVQPDGTMTDTGVDTSSPSGTPVRYADTMVRVGAPGSGHKVAGSWRVSKLNTLTADGLAFTFAVTGKQVTYTTPTGEKLSGMIGGPATPWTGDTAGALGAFSMPTPNTLRISTTLKGKPTGMVDILLAPGGGALDITAKNLLQNTTTKLKAVKS